VPRLLAAIVALADPELVILGGAWGGHPAILAAVREEIEQQPRSIVVRPAQHTVEPSLTGARQDGLTRLRTQIITSASLERR
jgi:predicted NBD/HSP70 family sugar kinase